MENKENEEISEKLENGEKKRKINIIKFVLIFLIILILLLSVGSGIYYFYNRRQDEIDKIEIERLENVLKGEDKEVEYGSEITYEDLKNSLLNMNELNNEILYEIKINNEVKSDEENYRFMNIGKLEIKTEVKNKNDSQKVLKINTDFTSLQNFFRNFKVTYEPKDYTVTKTNIYDVIDTQKPIIEGVSDKEIYKGEEINLKDGIKATDPVDGELEITINGEVKNNEIGEYIVKVIAEDKNKNETSQEFKVKVKEQPKEQQKEQTISKTNKTTSKSKENNTNNSNNTSNKTNRKYSNAIIKKYYSNCTDEQIAEAEAIAKGIATKAKKSSSDAIQQIAYAAREVSGYYWRYCNYDSTYSNPYYRSPYGVFCAGIATCSGTTRALGRVLDHMGYSWKHINENKYTHQWNELTVNGQKAWADGMAGVAGLGDYPL